jgi:hypothetical protein
MTASDTPNFGAPELANLLAGTAFAAAQRAGAPLLITRIEPPRLLYVSDSALALFHVSDLKTLDQAVLAGVSPGAKRLRDLSRLLPVNGQPRLELLRFFAGRTPLTVSLSCARLRDASGAEFLVASSLTSPRSATLSRHPRAQANVSSGASTAP